MSCVSLPLGARIWLHAFSRAWIRSPRYAWKLAGSRTAAGFRTAHQRPAYAHDTGGETGTNVAVDLHEHPDLRANPGGDSQGTLGIFSQRGQSRRSCRGAKNRSGREPSAHSLAFRPGCNPWIPDNFSHPARAVGELGSRIDGTIRT